MAQQKSLDELLRGTKAKDDSAGNDTMSNDGDGDSDASKAVDPVAKPVTDTTTDAFLGRPPKGETPDQRIKRIEQAQSVERVRADKLADERGSTLTHQNAENVTVKPIGNPGLGDPVTGDVLHKDMGNTEPHHISVDKAGNVITGNTPSAAEVSVVAKIDEVQEEKRKVEQGKAEQIQKDKAEEAERERNREPERDENSDMIVRDVKDDPTPLAPISPPIVLSSIDTNSGIPEVDGDYIKGDRDQPPPRIDKDDKAMARNSDFTRLNNAQVSNVQDKGDVWLYSVRPGLGAWITASERFTFSGNYLKNVDRKTADYILEHYSKYVHEVPNEEKEEV